MEIDIERERERGREGAREREREGGEEPVAGVSFPRKHQQPNW